MVRLHHRIGLFLSAIFFSLFLIVLSCRTSGDKTDTSTFIAQGHTIRDRIYPPSEYTRTLFDALTFQGYLQSLPLKPAGSKVKYFDGREKLSRNVYHSVVDLPIGKRDLHQCADAIMRLRGEYLWKNKQYANIHFNLTNGFGVAYSKWMDGNRVQVSGNTTQWVKTKDPSNTYSDFWKYMEFIFAYAGTASLENELILVDSHDIQVGDILIQGGFPGHAVIVVDQAMHAKGNKIFLLAQSYMPAQEIQVLLNPNDADLSPWYDLTKHETQTPEWTFSIDDMKRFP